MLFDIRQRTGYLLLAVTLGQVILISAQVNSSSGVPVIESVALGVFSEIDRAVSSWFGNVGNAWSSYVALRSLSKENVVLKRQVADLQVRLQEQQALARRSETLQALLNLRNRSRLAVVSAEVIAGDATPWFRTLTIDRGARDGIQPDLAVIAPAGVVGRVIGRPTSRAARVQLLIDRSAAVGAMLERSRTGGLITGETDDPPLRLDYVSNLADVDVGDRVVTSGIEGIYPKGFLIGYVERVQQGRGLHQVIGVRPAVDFDGLEGVLVVMRGRKVPAAEASP